MNPLVLAPLIMAPICFFAGIYHFGIYISQREDKSNLSFSLLCLAVGLYDIFSFGLYSSQNVYQGMIWQGLQLSIINMIAIGMIWFVYFTTQAGSKKIFKLQSAVFHVFFFVSFLFFFNLKDADKLISKKDAHFGFLHITYFESAPNLISNLEIIFILICLVYLLYVLIRGYKKYSSKHIRSVILGLAIYFLSSLNDALVYAGVYQFIYTMEYAFMLLIITMTRFLFTKFVDLQKKLILQLQTDSLTTLPNRKKLLMDVEKSGRPFAVLINIDSFQEINDFYGNEVGDLVLQEMTVRLKKLSTRFPFLIYKMNGDEYVILIDLDNNPDKLSKEDCLNIIQAIFEEINDRNFKYQEIEINVRVTIGVSYYDPDEYPHSLNNLKGKVLNNSDMALKQARKLGKSFVVYDESMEIHKLYENNLFWTKKLKEALVEDRITPFYQPIINNRNGKVEKYECLVRMIDPDGSIISPFKFLELSQKVRLYNKITAAVMRKSFQTFEGLDFEFSINLSVNDILNEETNAMIRQLLSRNSDLAPHVVFEILESEGISNYNEMTNFIREIKEYKCKFAIDDFGSGYSNFDHIIKLEVDYIKIDSSIIKNLNKDRHSYIIAKMISNAAKDLGLLTIAEFVESREIYDKCKEIGIDYSQGYFFSEPKANIGI